MRKNGSIDILKPQQVKNEKGIVITQYVKDRSVTCNWQPLKYNVQYKPHGITDKTSNFAIVDDAQLIENYFLPQGNPNQFNVSYRIGYKGCQYIINSILPYNRHIELYLEQVI